MARTRAVITGAVQELSASDVEVSVAAIIRAAGVSRATFYSHFASLDELALALTRDAFDGIEALWAEDEGDPAAAMWRSQQSLVAHYRRNHGLYSAIAALPVSKDAYLVGVRGMAGVIEHALSESVRRPAGLEAEPTARYIAGAAFGLIDAWLTGELVLDDDALVEHLVRLLPTWFSGLR